MWAHLDPVWAHFLIFLSFGPSLGSFWEKVHGFRTLDLIWAHYGLITGSLWAHFWSFHEPIMSPRQIQPVGSFWAHFLSPRCAHYGSKMSPWAHLGSWWAHLGLIALYRHFAFALNTGTAHVRSEFFIDPGIISIALLPIMLSFIFVNDGVLSNWPIHLFHNELELNTKLFSEIPRTHLGGNSLF